MGDPKKQRKSYETPRHPWRKDQLEVELHLMGEYGLRNKRELWRYKTMLSQVRGIARSLLGATEAERARLEREYLSKLGRIGVLSESASIDDILDLDIRDLLERRLQTLVFRRGLAKTLFQARQLVSHGHIAVAGTSGVCSRLRCEERRGIEAEVFRTQSSVEERSSFKEGCGGCGSRPSCLRTLMHTITAEFSCAQAGRILGQAL